MKKNCILLLLMAAMLGACDSADNFKISGEMAGNPTMNLYVKYYGNDRVMTGVTAVRGGKFEFVGNSQQPSIVEIVDNEYRVLGRLYMQNGDKVSVKLDRRNPYMMEVKGTPINEQWAAAVRPDADSLYRGTPATRNAIIEKYIANNPDNLVSSLLFVSSYDASISPLRADSVVQSINADVRPGRIFDSFATVAAHYVADDSHASIDTLRYRPLVMDTVELFVARKNKASLLVFTNDRAQRTDTLVPKLKELHGKRGLQIVDIMLVPDTTTWRNFVRRDSAKWTQGWLPGGLFAQGIDRLAIPKLPYYIVVDSAGTQLYRGASLSAATFAIEQPLRKK